MSDNSLPDEILSEILAPRAQNLRRQSTSAYLVVCKSWLRVATPLLYNVVILRSKDQAKALGRTLAGNPELGGFIRKLRLEGGYGPIMQKILASSPNITDLYLTLAIWSPDTTEGLVAGLLLISPRKLILRDIMKKPPKNKHVAALVSTVVDAAKLWENLTELDWPYTHEPRGRQLASALAQHGRITRLAVPTLMSAHVMYDALRWTNCPVTSVVIKDVPPKEKDLEGYFSHPELREMLRESLHKARNNGIRSDDIAQPSLNPSYIPMRDCSEDIQDAIWSRIIYFAMDVPGHVEELPVRNARSLPTTKRKISLLLVCKRFSRIGFQHFYTHFNAKFGNNRSPLEPMRVAFATQWPAIQTFGANNCPFSAVAALAQGSGRSLATLDIGVYDLGDIPLSGLPFQQLTALRRLAWRSNIRFPDHFVIQLDALPALEYLQFEGFDQGTFLAPLVAVALPSLRTFVCDRPMDLTAFFTTHGSKMTELSLGQSETGTGRSFLDMCPKLQILRVGGSSPPSAADLRSSTGNHSLTSLRLSGWWDKRAMHGAWADFLEYFSKDDLRLLALTEIRVRAIEWPLTERDIAKSPFTEWAAELLKREGIQLLDREGKGWRPRLKIRGRA
ncbi:F-box domain-containing protein [Mycena chlorophos]|uniref:F-box domain-containing protein n=1 Tax=Mycena chlorophos TaxID=658473 RepID=A0A8H6WHX1_MYCCL|nr:F-box domain-containing protein [Mycena chlorophos]